MTKQNDTRTAANDGTLDQARVTATQTLETNPLGVLAGGLALGAVVGALVPRSDKERDLLRPVGSRIGATAAAAFAAAKEAGLTELDQRGLTPSAARDQAKSLLDNVVKAASNAATTGVKAAKQEATGAAASGGDQAMGGDQPDSTGGTGDSVPPADPHSQVMVADTDASDFRSAV